MAKESAESKKAAPGITVTGFLPAVVKSKSSSPAAASGPMPRMPFSEWKMICRSGTMWLATLSGMPMPRFTVAPSGMAWATRHAI